MSLLFALACGGLPEVEAPEVSVVADAAPPATEAELASTEADPGPPPLEPRHPPLPPAEEQPITVLVADDGEEWLEGAPPYPALYAVDGDLDTTWVVRNRGSFVLKPARVTAFEFVPGYTKSPALWQANRRVQRLRWREWGPRPGRHGVRTAPGPWHEVDIAAPDSLPDDPWVRVPVSDGSVEIHAIEIEVLEASESTRFDDVCISEIRFLGAQLRPVEVHPRYTSMDSSVGGIGYPGARWGSWAYDFESCTIFRDNGFERWEFHGRCRQVAEGWHLRGEGVTEVCEAGHCDVSREPVDKTYRFHPISSCLAIIGERPFTRCR